MGKESITLKDVTRPLFEINKIDTKESAELREAERQRNLERAKLEYQTLENSYQGDLDALEAKKALLMKQAEDNTLRDEYGNEIPIAQTKKCMGMITKKESKTDRIKRLKGMVKDRYDRDLKMLDFRKERAKKRVTYYSRTNIVNMLGQEQHQHSFSEQRRKMLKSYLATNAESDMGRKFLPEQEELKNTYQDFLKAVKNYAVSSGAVASSYMKDKVYEKNGKKVSTYSSFKDQLERDKEVEKYREVQRTLKELKVKAAEDPGIMMMLRGYEDLFTQITDGTLKVPKDAEIMRCSNNVVIGEDKKEKDQRRNPVELLPAENVPLFAHEPTVEDLTQGSLGDCYLVTTLSAIVNTEPQVIKDMMKDNGRTVTVRLFRPVQDDEKGLITNAVYVEVPKSRIKKNGAQGALWVNAIELAYCAISQEANKYDKALNKAKFAMGEIGFSRLKAEVDNEFEAQEDKLRNKGLNKNELRICKKMNFEEGMEKRLKRVTDEKGIKGYKEFVKTLREQEELNKNRLDLTEISGGNLNNFYLAVMGKPMQGTYLGSEKKTTYMNRLNYFLDDMMGHYMQEHKEEWSSISEKEKEKDRLQEEKDRADKDYADLKNAHFRQKELLGKEKLSDEEKAELKELNEKFGEYSTHKEKSLELLNQRNDLEKQVSAATRRIKEVTLKENLGRIFLDKLFGAREILHRRSGEDEISKLMTREDLKNELTSTWETLKGNLSDPGVLKETMTKLQSYGEFATFKNYMQSQNKDPEQEILDFAKNMFLYMQKHQEENTVLNYERFSGKYSVKAKEAFEELKANLEKRMVVTTGTYNLVQGDLSGESGEHFFDGIASGHGYSIIGTREEERGDKKIYYVKVKNPWKHSGIVYSEENGKIEVENSLSDVTSGECEIELNDFMSRFDVIYYGDSKPVELK